MHLFMYLISVVEPWQKVLLAQMRVFCFLLQLQTFAAAKMPRWRNLTGPKHQLPSFEPLTAGTSSPIGMANRMPVYCTSSLGKAQCRGFLSPDGHSRMFLQNADPRFQQLERYTEPDKGDKHHPDRRITRPKLSRVTFLFLFILPLLLPLLVVAVTLSVSIHCNTQDPSYQSTSLHNVQHAIFSRPGGFGSYCLRTRNSHWRIHLLTTWRPHGEVNSSCGPYGSGLRRGLH